jgi:uncharacterized protein (DUF2062 family)
MLLTEVVHPQHRAPFTTIYNCLWNLGSFCMLNHPVLASYRSQLTATSLQCHRLWSPICEERLVVANLDPLSDYTGHRAAYLRLG